MLQIISRAMALGLAGERSDVPLKSNMRWVLNNLVLASQLRKQVGKDFLKHCLSLTSVRSRHAHKTLLNAFKSQTRPNYGAHLWITNGAATISFWDMGQAEWHLDWCNIRWKCCFCSGLGSPWKLILHKCLIMPCNCRYPLAGIWMFLLICSYFERLRWC